MAHTRYKPVESKHIINAQIKDEKRIQQLLDGMLDFCSDEQFLMLFKKLCRYYWFINPYETAQYIQTYRELWDNEEDIHAD